MILLMMLVLGWSERGRLYLCAWGKVSCAEHENEAEVQNASIDHAERVRACF